MACAILPVAVSSIPPASVVKVVGTWVPDTHVAIAPVATVGAAAWGPVNIKPVGHSEDARCAVFPAGQVSTPDVVYVGRAADADPIVATSVAATRAVAAFRRATRRSVMAGTRGRRSFAETLLSDPIFKASKRPRIDLSSQEQELMKAQALLSKEYAEKLAAWRATLGQSAATA